MLIKFTKGWGKNDEGSTAVEFSFVALPLILMMIGIIEMSLMFTAQSLLEASTGSAARIIRTGQLQQAGSPEDLFVDTMCDFAEMLIPCEDIRYQVMSLNDFGEADGVPEPTFDENGEMEDSGFSPGGVNDVVMIRTSYAYPIVTPIMQLVLPNNDNNSRTLVSTIVFKTEPYEFDESPF